MALMLPLRIALGVIAALALTGAAAAQEGRQPSMCQAIAEAIPQANFVSLATPVDVESYDVAIRYVGHSTFRIVSPEGVTIATDYAGFAGSGPTPDVVTMNHAHTSHYTDFPDPAITHVLRGWNPEGGRAEHHLVVGDVLIRNVPTDIRRFGTVEPYGNSIFIFEIAGLCIGHLGHLHHVPGPEHYAEIGRLDVVFVPVDGSYTMSQPQMIAVVQRLRASIVIPMHFFTTYNLARFVDGMRDQFEIDIRTESDLTVSLNTLPRSPTVVVLPGY